MTRRTGMLVSLLAGGCVGVVASLMPMIFGPLLFPQAISGPTLGENIVGWSIPAFFFIFGAIGFFIARRLVVRFIDHDGPDTNRTFTQLKMEAYQLTTDELLKRMPKEQAITHVHGILRRMEESLNVPDIPAAKVRLEKVLEDLKRS